MKGPRKIKFIFHLPIIFPPSVESPSNPRARARSEEFVVMRQISLSGFGLIKEGLSRISLISHLPIIFPPSVESPSAPRACIEEFVVVNLISLFGFGI